MFVVAELEHYAYMYLALQYYGDYINLMYASLTSVCAWMFLRAYEFTVPLYDVIMKKVDEHAVG